MTSQISKPHYSIFPAARRPKGTLQPHTSHDPHIDRWCHRLPACPRPLRTSCSGGGYAQGLESGLATGAHSCTSISGPRHVQPTLAFSKEGGGTSRRTGIDRVFLFKRGPVSKLDQEGTQTSRYVKGARALPHTWFEDIGRQTLALWMGLTKAQHSGTCPFAEAGTGTVKEAANK